MFRRIHPTITNNTKITKMAVSTTTTANTTINHAAYLDAPKARPLSVRPAPMPVPGPGQILVRNRALAMNPLEQKLQARAMYPLPYPVILGSDVAGDVVSVGPSSSTSTSTGTSTTTTTTTTAASPRFQPGDRVAGVTSGFVTSRNEDRGFQEFCLLDERLAFPVPSSSSSSSSVTTDSNVAYEDAVVLPLAVTTAAAGLFQAEGLGLEVPVVHGSDSSSSAVGAGGKSRGTVLVWGGASAVGGNAIQLARAAGYDVVTTASPRNFDHVTKDGLGAVAAVDYRSESVVAELMAAFEGIGDGGKCVGVLDAVGGAAWAPVFDFAARMGVKKVMTSLAGFPEPPEGVEVRQIASMAIRDTHVAGAIFGEFLPNALSDGSYKMAPEAKVVGHGLESIQEALDVLGEGVSAKKIVVTL